MGSNDINHTSYRNNDGYINPNFKAGEVKTETISPQTKVTYNTKESALRAAESMSKKYNKHFSTYKCLFCDGYHVGKNRDNK